MEVALFTLEVEDTEIAVEVSGSRTVLAELRDAGVPLVWGCRAGACRTCALRLVRGKVAMAAATALSEEQFRDGVFLACVTYPQGDLVVALPTDGPFVTALPWSE